MKAIKQIALGVSVVGLTACSISNAKTGTDPVGQTYTLTVSPTIPPRDRLPATSEMKLVSFDVATYIERQCEDGWKQAECEVFAQTDKSGSLMGYLIIQGTGNEQSFTTDTVTSFGTECILGGALEDIERLPNGEFRARSMFETKEATGMIYLDRVGNNLKVNDERWNYCYPDRHINDVYTFIGSYRRTLDRTKWPAVPS